MSKSKLRERLIYLHLAGFFIRDETIFTVPGVLAQQNEKNLNVNVY